MSRYVAIALGGYLTFGSAVGHDVLTTYPASPLVSACRLLLAIVVALSYPLQSHPARGCALSLARAVERHQRKVAVGGFVAPPAHPAAALPELHRGSGESATTDPTGQGAAAAGAGEHGLPTPWADSPRASALVSLLFLLLTTAIAVTVDDLSIILKVVGATGSVVVSYLLPGVCYFRLCPEPTSPMRYAALCLVLLGATLMPLSITLIFV